MKQARDSEQRESARAKRAIAQVRSAFRKQVHDQLDAYLHEPDPTTGLPTIDVLIAYVGQGWGCSVLGCARTHANLLGPSVVGDPSPRQPGRNRRSDAVFYVRGLRLLCGVLSGGVRAWR